MIVKFLSEKERLNQGLSPETKEAIRQLKEKERAERKHIFCHCGKEMVPIVLQCPDKNCIYNLMDVRRSDL